jgi:hypothetical protein
MSTWLGDIALGATLDCKFCTVSTIGAPTTLAGSPVVSAYVDNGTTELTAGITLSVDFDGRAGLHNVRVVASSGNGYATATNVQLVLTAGTVGGTSVVGYVIGQFSIEARASLRPTVAGRTLDVSATGEAGLDFDNVKDATGAHTLTNITVPVVTTVTNDVGITQAGADKVWASAARSLTDKVGFALSAAGIQAIWDALTSALTTVGSIGKRLADFITGDAFVRLGAPAGASVSADIAAIQAKTVNLPASPAAVSNVPTAIQNADALLDRDMATGTDSGSTTVRTPRQALRFLRNKRTSAAGTLTVYKENDSVASWDAALTTDAAAVPVVTVDPAGP